MVVETGSSAALAERIEGVKARLEELREQDIENTGGIGAGIAVGDDVTELRAARREIRDEIEDLVAALPHLEQQLAAAQTVEHGAAFRAWVAKEEEQVAQMRVIGRELRPHLAAVQRLVTEMRALHADHADNTRKKIDHFARKAGARQPGAPSLADEAGFERRMFDTDLPAFANLLKQHDALNPAVTP